LEKDKEKEILATKPTTQPKQEKVDLYYAPSTKTFTTYKTVAGDTSLTYDILEGLYRRTIMRRIVDKPSQDATRLGYKIHVENENGSPHENAEAICREITRMIKRRTLKTNIQRPKTIRRRLPLPKTRKRKPIRNSRHRTDLQCKPTIH